MRPSSLKVICCPLVVPSITTDQVKTAFPSCEDRDYLPSHPQSCDPVLLFWRHAKLKVSVKRARQPIRMPDSIELLESDLSCLFARYPDINFDVAAEFVSEPVASDHFSSPSSDNDTDRDETPGTKLSISTAHTTPLRSPPRTARPSDQRNVEAFFRQVNSADLPAACQGGFKVLATEMRDLGAMLLPGNGPCLKGYNPIIIAKISWRSQAMLARLQESNCNVTEQVNNVDFVKSRAPFTIDPAVQDLWCNYRQRARLIAE